jgi:hypothetical protein
MRRVHTVANGNAAFLGAVLIFGRVYKRILAQCVAFACAALVKSNASVDIDHRQSLCAAVSDATHKAWEGQMLFVVRWTIPHTSREEAIGRFLRTGGAPPDGVKMLSRYHSADGEYGFAIAEASDAVALGKWTIAWNDLLIMDSRPVLDDEGLGLVLQSHAATSAKTKKS